MSRIERVIFRITMIKNYRRGLIIVVSCVSKSFPLTGIYAGHRASPALGDHFKGQVQVEAKTFKNPTSWIEMPTAESDTFVIHSLPRCVGGAAAVTTGKAAGQLPDHIPVQCGFIMTVMNIFET